MPDQHCLLIVPGIVLSFDDEPFFPWNGTVSFQALLTLKTVFWWKTCIFSGEKLIIL